MNNDKEIEALYREFKNEFLRNTSMYPLDEEQRIDVYQDAFVAMYEILKYKKRKIQKGFKNYLYGIGRNMILDKIKTEIKDRKRKEALLIAQKGIDLSYYDLENLNTMQSKIHDALKQLSESCRKILILFYFRNYSIEAIMHSMSYKNENVTKSHKSRCIKGLRAFFTLNNQ